MSKKIGIREELKEWTMILLFFGSIVSAGVFGGFMLYNTFELNNAREPTAWIIDAQDELRNAQNEWEAWDAIPHIEVAIAITRAYDGDTTSMEYWLEQAENIAHETNEIQYKRRMNDLDTALANISFPSRETPLSSYHAGEVLLFFLLAISSIIILLADIWWIGRH